MISAFGTFLVTNGRDEGISEPIVDIELDSGLLTLRFRLAGGG